ncbi:MAG: hypothetical protein LBF69_05270 [Prevotellaceae bacterium]|nr:hypothetical protein [Prevotellaceae bacterium]
MENKQNAGTGKNSTEAGMQAGQNTAWREFREQVLKDKMDSVIKCVGELFDFGGLSMLVERLCYYIDDTLHELTEEDKDGGSEGKEFTKSKHNAIFELTYMIRHLSKLYEEYGYFKSVEKHEKQ